MKRYTLLIYFLLGIGIQVHAQQVRLDIQAGPNFSTLSASSGNDFESEVKLGNHVGVEAAIRFSKNMEWYGGISLSEINFNRRYNSPDEIELFYRFKTVGFPVGIRFIIPGELFEGSFSAGIQPFVVSGHDDERFSNEIDVQQQFELSDEIQDSGILAEPGFKVSYALDEDTKVFAGFKYGFDILEIYKSEIESRRLHRFDLKVGLSIVLF